MGIAGAARPMVSTNKSTTVWLSCAFGPCAHSLTPRTAPPSLAPSFTLCGSFIFSYCKHHFVSQGIWLCHWEGKDSVSSINIRCKSPEKDSDWPSWVTWSNLDQSLYQGWDTEIDPSGSCAEASDVMGSALFKGRRLFFQAKQQSFSSSVSLSPCLEIC